MILARLHERLLVHATCGQQTGLHLMVECWVEVQMSFTSPEATQGSFGWCIERDRLVDDG